MRRSRRRGGALLMVLWLSAALSAIAFAVALRVRTEIDRADGGQQGLRAYYLAVGAAYRAMHYMKYGPGPLDASGWPKWWDARVTRLAMRFPEGEAVVEITPESSKLNVNYVSRDELERLLLALGAPPERGRLIAHAILHWRGSEISDLDTLYLSSAPSFRAPRASLQLNEELMSVAGVTPELYYGGWARTPEGALVRRPGLRDCLSIYSSGKGLDIRTVQPAVMVAVGVPAPAAEMVARLRQQAPLDFQALAPLLGPAAARFRVGGDNIYTLRATARARKADGRLGEARRTVSMVFQLYSAISPDGSRVLGWEDAALPSMEVEGWQR